MELVVAGRIGGLALDVYSKEPLAMAGHPMSALFGRDDEMWQRRPDGGRPGRVKQVRLAIRLSRWCLAQHFLDRRAKRDLVVGHHGSPRSTMCRTGPAREELISPYAGCYAND